MMMSSTDPTRSSLSLYTGCPRMVRLALQPVVTSRSSATLTPTVVEPATCACEMVGPIRAILASSRMRIDVMAGLRVKSGPSRRTVCVVMGATGGARPTGGASMAGKASLRKLHRARLEVSICLLSLGFSQVSFGRSRRWVTGVAQFKPRTRTVPGLKRLRSGRRGMHLRWSEPQQHKYYDLQHRPLFLEIIPTDLRLSG